MDLSVSKDILFAGSPATLLFSMQNVGDAQPPLQPTAQTNPGLSYPVPVGENGMGRYFILSVRGSF